MKVRASATSSAFKVNSSSFPAHFKILAMETRLIPKERLRSALKSSKPFPFNMRATRATWAESIACRKECELIVNQRGKKKEEEGKEKVKIERGYLELDSLCRTIKISFNNQILQSFNNLLQKGSLLQLSLEHFGYVCKKRGGGGVWFAGSWFCDLVFDLKMKQALRAILGSIYNGQFFFSWCRNFVIWFCVGDERFRNLKIELSPAQNDFFRQFLVLKFFTK